jgi:hypothetical protein
MVDIKKENKNNVYIWSAPRALPEYIFLLRSGNDYWRSLLFVPFVEEITQAST